MKYFVDLYTLQSLKINRIGYADCVKMYVTAEVIQINLVRVSYNPPYPTVSFSAFRLHQHHTYSYIYSGIFGIVYVQ